MSKIVLANDGIIIFGPIYLSPLDVMDFFPHLGHEISEAQLVNSLHHQHQCPYYKNACIYKALTQNKLNNSFGN